MAVALITTHKIVVMLPSPMGDAVLATPALIYLRKTFPKAEITLLGNKVPCDILSDSGFADIILPFGEHSIKGFSIIKTAKWLKAKDFDAAFIMPNSFRSALLCTLAGIKERIGYDRDGRGLLLNASVAPFRLLNGFMPLSMIDHYNYLVQRALPFIDGPDKNNDVPLSRKIRLGFTETNQAELDVQLANWHINSNDQVILLVPGGAFGGSKWWRPERFGEVAGRLIKRDFKVILFCAPNDIEREISKNVQASCDAPLLSLVDTSLSLGAIKALVKRAALMVSNDTGPCHISAAFDVPLVTLFGPTDPRWTWTGYQGETRLRIDVDCGPCQKSVCPLDHRCMDKLEITSVMKSIDAALQGQHDIMALDAQAPYKIYDEPYLPFKHGKGVVHLASQSFLANAGFDSVENIFKKASMDTYLSIETADGNETKVLIKRYGKRSIMMRLTMICLGKRKRSVAQKVFLSAIKLAQTNINADRPIAFGETISFFGEIESFVLLKVRND